MKIAERIVLVLITLFLIAAAGWLYFAVTREPESGTERARTTVIQDTGMGTSTEQEDWRRYYPVTTPVTIGSTTVLASVAETVPERIQGLSNTPYLPENVVKLFVFGAEGFHSIWMKDMLYPLDIIWATREGEIVHIEENVSPDTFPQSFSSPVPAWYVVEANAGFVAQHEIALGDQLTRVVQE